MIEFVVGGGGGGGGGWVGGWVVCKPILVFSLSLGQAEQIQIGASVEEIMHIL